MKKRLFIAGCLCAVLLAILWIPSPAPPVPIVWQVNVPWYCGSPLSLGPDGTVYARTVLSLLALDRSGKQQWSTPAEVMVSSSPALGPDGTIYLKEWARPKRLNDGTYSTNTGLLALRPDGAVKWRFSINDIVEHSAATFALDSRGAVYFTAGKDFFSPKTLFAVGADGREQWHFDSPGNLTAPVTITRDGSILFESWGKTNADFLRLDAGGKRMGSLAIIKRGSSSFSMDWDGTTYLPGDIGNTMTALNADGAPRWRFRSPFRAFDAPTIGADGSLYFTANRRSGDTFLVALTKEGGEKWKFALSSHWSFHPPAVASDGTLYVASSDPKVTAVNPDGTVKWVFRPPRPQRFRSSWRPSLIPIPVNWKDFKSQFFSGDRNVFAGPATLGLGGTLYVGFGGPYDTFYALKVGAGLATNSPWPMASGNLQLTRRVADRPAGETRKQAP